MMYQMSYAFGFALASAVPHIVNLFLKKKKWWLFGLGVGLLVFASVGPIIKMVKFYPLLGNLVFRTGDFYGILIGAVFAVLALIYMLVKWNQEKKKQKGNNKKKKGAKGNAKQNAKGNAKGKQPQRKK